MPNYSKTLFYKIVCKDLTIKNNYSGHTTNMIHRKSSHKGRCNNPNNPNYNIRLYQFIRDNGGWDNWDMILLEERDCKNKLEARKNEREWYEKLNSDLNIETPYRSPEEFIEQKKQSHINWVNKNKERRREYMKEYNKQYAIKQKLTKE